MTDAQQIITEYEVGADIRAVAAKHGISYQRVHQILMANAIPRRSRGNPANCDRAAVIEGYQSGRPYKEICRHHEIAQSTILKILRDAEIPTNRQLTPTQREAILNDYRNGMWPKEIATKHHITLGNLNKIKRAAGEPNRFRPNRKRRPA